MSQLKIDFLDIKDAFIVTGRKFSDERGFFEEIYNESKFAVPITKKWRQASIAESKVDVIRGMHCSNYAKFVTCVKGEVYDVIVDLRPDSPTFMKWQGVSLNSSSSDPVSLYVPKRCGHGYYCKQQDSLLVYLQDGCFNASEDINLHPFDPSINIQWPKPFSSYIISAKDKASPQLAEIKHLLEFSKLNLLNPLTEKAVLVYGSTGFLGKCLLEELVKLNKPFRIGAARLENRGDLIKEIKETAPSHVICMAGLTGKPNIFWCEKNQIETIRINVIGQLNVADVANEFNLHCTLITTGITYTYDEDHKVNSGKGFTEEEKPNFDRNFYSKMRIMEEELLKSYPNVLNLRVQYPTTGDLNPSSFIQKIVRFKQIQSIPLSLTIVDDLWPVLIDMAEKKIAGTFNFNNPGAISHDEVLKAYKEIVDKDHQWENVEVDMSNRSAAELSADKLLKLGYKIPHVKESVKALMDKILKEKTGAHNRLLSVNAKYEPKNILLTGGAGFIGSHVVIHLVKKYKNCHVFVYDILDYCSNLKNLDEIKNEVNYTFIKGDICNFQMVQFVINSYNIDTIMHFAAQSHVDFSIRNSLKFTKVNVLGRL
jgi:dTDP-4-dehydrorhamnose 3,5-epimerase